MSTSDYDHECRMLDTLIERRDIGVVFQPIVNIEEGRIHAFEALTRPRPQSGFNSPTALFHIAERHGKLWELEQVSREAAFAAAARWNERIKLFLNSSPAVFGDDRFVDEIRRCLRETVGLTAERVVLEITELSDESMDQRLVERASQFVAAGFKVAVDDVGAGTSGLNRIVQIRPQWIKLDTQFVRSIHADPFRQNLVRFFVHFARLSNIDLVAEGIETADELTAVANLGVRFAQGFYLARPAPREVIDSADYELDIRRKWRVIEERAAATISVAVNAGTAAEPVVQMPMTMTVARGMQLLKKNEQAAGIVTMDGRRPAGWVWRANIESAHAEGHERMLLGELMNPHIVRVSPETTLLEALEVACVMEDQGPADPLIVTEGSRVRGIVRLRELIRWATREGRAGSTVRMGLTELPTRVQADRHVMESILAWRSGHTGPLYADAAFVDLRRFTDYNTAFGFNVGDRLIRTLADMIESEVRSQLTTCFVAHISDDRFLVTAPEGELGPKLYKLIERFEEFADSMGVTHVPFAVSAGQPLKLPRPAIRVLMLDGVLREISDARTLYRLEQELREKCRSDEPHDGDVASRLVMDDRSRWSTDRRVA